MDPEEGGFSGSGQPEKSQGAIGFLSNTGSDSKKTTKLSSQNKMLCRILNDQLLVVFGASLPKQLKTSEVDPPLIKHSGSTYASTIQHGV